MRRNGADPLDVTRDLFEVFLAIRWPDRKAETITSHVNVFREVFAVLSGDDDVRKTRAPDDSFISLTADGASRLYRTAMDGKMLELWEPYHPP
jgi:hypothetical protein